MKSEFSDSKVMDPGTVIDGRFELIALIDFSAVSQIYAARSLSMERNVWLKTVSPDFSHDSSYFENFQLQARVHAAAAHKNVARLHEFFVHDRNPFLVLEYLEGKKLSEFLSDSEALPFQLILPVLIQICEALDAAHRKGVIHRQLKADCIFLSTNKSDCEFVKIIDFESAQFQSASRKGEFYVPLQLADKDDCYLAPEQILGRTLDQRADVFALGALIYQILSGRAAFDGREMKRVLREHDFLRPKKFKDLRPDLEIPQVLEDLVFKALEARPADRFASMTEMKQALIFALGSASAAGMQSFFEQARRLLLEADKNL
ncbi:MAG: serine/threonine protein kinase [Candidatus Obscuribacterales bacterium]|nr:serine/threonine protein kinase [Candidatus Obscuribacterales bacterium]